MTHPTREQLLAADKKLAGDCIDMVVINRCKIQKDQGIRELLTYAHETACELLLAKKEITKLLGSE